MRSSLILALVLPLAGGALAQKVDAPRSGQTVRDSNKARVGTIDRINRDGSIQILVGSSFVTLPADKLSVTDGGVTVALTKREVAKLR
jgi:hypothetical protein